MNGNMESFSKDKDMAELLELLSQMKNRDGYEKLLDTISYVDSLENTLSSMMKQLVDMREEIKTVHEQNEYMMTKAERGIKDVLVEHLAKVENGIQELHGRLVEAKESLKKFAAFTVQKAKVFGNSVLLKLVDAVHFRQTLDGIRDKADKMANRLDSMSDMVEDYKKHMEPSFTYEQEMDNFMEDRVAEGVTYGCNQDAYEDFKASYEKKQSADSVTEAVQKQMQSAINEKGR
jgi:hypothetical protein